jgi:hypothetical protein
MRFPNSTLASLLDADTRLGTSDYSTDRACLSILTLQHCPISSATETACPVRVNEEKEGKVGIDNQTGLCYNEFIKPV